MDSSVRTPSELWSGFALDPRDPAHAGLRASDADRERIQRVLADAFADGRLDREEHDERTTPWWPHAPSATCRRWCTTSWPPPRATSTAGLVRRVTAARARAAGRASTGRPSGAGPSSASSAPP